MTYRAAMTASGLALLLGCGPQPEPPAASDFAILARAEPGFQQARADNPLRFPEDYGPHPGYRIEWWYLTANLEDHQGHPYGVQWTLFRTAIEPPGTPAPENPWQHPQVFMAHFAITTPHRHVAYQRYARGGSHAGAARAGASAEPFAAWLDDWSLSSIGQGWLPLELQAYQHPNAVRLRLDSELPLVLHGVAGFSQKHPDGGGSLYYSQPYLAATGELVVDGKVIPVTGQAWLDREWSSQFLQPDQAGWDWFALHLDSGEKLMLYRLRPRPAHATGAASLYGVLMDRAGNRRILDPGRIELSVIQTVRVAHRDLPLNWRIRLPEIDRELEITPLHPDQWMDVDFAYWEGVVRVRGAGPKNSGTGYLELTGYAIH